VIRGGLVGLALVIAAAAVRAPAAPTPAARAARAPSAVGPRALARPANAVEAADDSDLARLIDDADGPREIWLRARVYHGDLEIHRPLALRGTVGATLQGNGSATVVTIAADDVVLDNLAIVGSGRRHTHEDSAVKARGERVRLSHLALDGNLFGANLQMCHACAVDHVVVRGADATAALRGDSIKLWESNDSIVADCLVERGRDIVVWYSRRVRLQRNVVRGNRYGTHFMYSHDSIVEDSDLRDNVVGIFVMYSARMRVERNVLAGARGAAGVGIGFKDCDGAEVRDNWIVANNTGVYLDRTPRSPSEPVLFSGNLFALDDAALRLHSSAQGVRFVDNDFRENVAIAAVEGGGNALGMSFTGNFWSDYAGYDLDGDGSGDVAFAPKQITSAMEDAHPALRFFDGTTALAMVEVVARAVPVLSPRPLLVDGSPRMNPHRGVEP
jgi:nitrous oxidase accessory protein